MTSIILFKDNKHAGVAAAHHRARHNANDNIRSMEFDMAEHERNWCSLAVFSLLLLVATVSIISPFLSIFSA